VEAETDGRKNHQDAVKARLGQTHFPGVVARAIERIKIEKRRDLVIKEKNDLATEKHFHKR
jgi:hypothetical protein